MEHPFLTPREPDDPPAPRRRRVAPACFALLVAAGGAAGAWAVATGRIPTTPAVNTPAADAHRPDLFDEQERADREVEQLIATLTEGHPTAAARLAQMRAVLGDERFLGELPDCLSRAGVARSLSADEWSRVAAARSRAAAVQKQIDAKDRTPEFAP